MELKKVMNPNHVLSIDEWIIDCYNFNIISGGGNAQDKPSYTPKTCIKIQPHSSEICKKHLKQASI